MAAKYELKVNKNKKYMFNLKAGNSEVILTSETYESKASALNGIESCKTNAADAANFQTKAAKNGETFFVLLAANKQVIGKSEMYKTAAGAKRGVASVQRNAGAPVVDLTEPPAK